MNQMETDFEYRDGWNWPRVMSYGWRAIGGSEPVGSVARVFFFRKYIPVFFSPQQTYTCSSTVWSGRLHQH
jgi:hypothetical protein